jgi:hypothetical protein
MNKISKHNSFAYLITVSILSSFAICLAVLYSKHRLTNIKYIETSVIIPLKKCDEFSSISINGLLSLHAKHKNKVIDEIRFRIRKCNDQMNLTEVLDTMKIERALYNWRVSYEYEIRKDYYGIGDEYNLEISRIGDNGKIINISIVKSSSCEDVKQIVRGIPTRIEPDDLNSQYFIITKKEAAILSLKIAICQNMNTIVEKDIYLSYKVDDESYIENVYDSKGLWINNFWGSTSGESRINILDCEFVGPSKKGINFNFLYTCSHNNNKVIDIPKTELFFSCMLDKDIELGDGVIVSIRWKKIK